MIPLTSSRRWPLLVLPTAVFMVMILIILALYGLGDVDESFKRFANALLTSFSVASGLLAVAMLSYADSRERPWAPVFAMMAMAVVGALLTFLTLMQAGDLMLEANGTPMAQILYNIVQLLVIFSALIIAAGLLMGIALSLITSREVEPLFNDSEQ